MAGRAGGEVVALGKPRQTPGALSLPEADESDAFSLRELALIARKRKWVVVVFMAGVVGLVTVWLSRTPRIYRATATLEINATPPRYLGTNVQEVAESANTGYWQSKEFLETQSQIIRSRAVSQRAADKAGLAQDADFLGLAGVADPAERARRMARVDAAAVLQRALKVETVKDTRILRVSVEDRSPQRARRLADALAEAYVEQNLDRKIDTTRGASRWLADQLDGLKDQLEKSELRLYEFKRDNDILAASFEDRQSIVSQRLGALNDALTRQRTRRAELDARVRTLAEARRRVAGGELDALEAVAPVAQSTLITTLKLRLLQLGEEQAETAGRYLDRHPRRLAVEERLVQGRAALQREIDKLVRTAEADAAEAVETDRQIVRLIDAAKSEQFALSKRSLDYTKLRRDQENNQRLYDLVLQRLKEADLSALLRTNNVALLDAAQLPVKPAWPNRRVTLVVAVLVGLVGGLALALLLERTDNTVRGPDDLERTLGLPFLGLVPTIFEEGQDRLPTAERARNRDLQVHRQPKSSVAECVRSVRTNLHFMSLDKPIKRVLVTSAGPQEGKTTVAINLGIAMAQAGSRTLLVDTDMRRPRIHRPFGLSHDRGLSSLLLGAARPEEALCETPVPGLHVLPCGPIPPNPAELLHTARFKQILGDLDTRFDRIILDSPPVAAVADGLILAGDADGVVLVVKAGVTPRDVARRARRALDDVNARILGVVMNDLNLASRAYGYYYYYYQRYGYAHGEKQADA